MIEIMTTLHYYIMLYMKSITHLLIHISWVYLNLHFNSLSIMQRWYGHVVIDCIPLTMCGWQATWTMCGWQASSTMCGWQASWTMRGWQASWTLYGWQASEIILHYLLVIQRCNPGVMCVVINALSHSIHLHVPYVLHII